MRIEPSSTINIYAGVEITKGHQIAFSSAEKQKTYFDNHIKFSQVPCTMVRKSTNRVRLQISGKTITNCNYLSFVNPDFDNRVFYAIISDYEYINNECVEITFVIDFIQSYMFDVKFSDDCFIDRESLSQYKQGVADTNAYDSALWEFRTPESLAVGEDLEKLNYTVSGAGSDGGYFFTSVDPNNEMATLIYFSDIDFDALDAEVTENKPSAQFEDFLNKVVGNAFGFYMKPGGACTTGSALTGTALNNRFNTVNYLVCCHGDEGPELIDMLTKWNAVSAIINIYSLENRFIINVFSGQTVANTTIFPPAVDEGSHKVKSGKLYQYPFAYLRVITPAGDIAEFHYENFSTISGGASATDREANFEAFVDVSQTPSLNILPKNYKIKIGDQYRDNINSVKFEQIPTAPYSTDSYLAQIAAYSAQIISRNTIDYQYDATARGYSALQSRIQAGRGVVAGVAGVAGGVANGNFGGALNAGFGGFDAGINTMRAQNEINRLQNELDMSDAAYQALAGDSDNAVTSNYAATRPAFATNKYIPSHGVGSDHYADYGWFNIMYIRVQLQSEILDKYDKYFQNFGYTSGRCGTPYIAGFFAGSTDDKTLPAWTDENTTYCKTSECHITGVPLPVAGFWENMFNAGIRWKNGDV